MPKSRIPACWCVHDDIEHLALSIRSFERSGDRIVFVSKSAWNGSAGDWEEAVGTAEAAGAEVVVGDWPDESLHRRAALEAMRLRGYKHVLIPDSDEIVEPGLLDQLVRIAAADASDLVRVRMDTFWKGPDYVIRPREDLAPILLLDARTAEHLHIREYTGRRPLALSAEHGLLLHLSYAGSDKRILRKISTWGHREEVGRSWFDRIWLGWDRDRLMPNLHPTHPECYGFAERVPVPELLRDAEDSREHFGDPLRTKKWPTVSVIVPLYGGEPEIQACLTSLVANTDLIHEIIVVDDRSPDDAAEIAASFQGVALYSNDTNRGFGATCNRGYAESAGDVIVFLNSDTVVPRAGLIRLIESLLSSGTIGAVGPFTNNSGYHQYVRPTYTSTATIELFAQDFAHRTTPDFEVNMLVGFCLAVRRSALEEVGAFDERFGAGMFEDNDLCYRLLRAGYRLKVAARSFVHHEGSRSLQRRQEHPTRLLGRNRLLYLEKWHRDVESGFSSHLAGLRPDPIVFDPARHPERVDAELAAKRDAARISLCMIVKNEERVIADCLESATRFFSQIVVVDTGSSDRTMEIARSFGAEVHEFAWTDSFSEARNVSLELAKGNWIFWMDADDTLPWGCGEHLLHIALNARPEIVAFVVPVQFVEQGPGGTRVDHVKLIRNLPGIQFEYRIHEQILPSLRRLGGEVARAEAYVLHSGYDSTPEGQARKRERDYRLLEMDLKEQGEQTFILFNWGMTDYYTGRFERAVGWLERSLLAGSEGESHLRKAYALLACSLRQLGRPDDGLAACVQGLQAVGEDPELRFHAGTILTDLGRFEEAKMQYLAMCPDIGQYFSSINQAILGPLRDHNLGVACRGLNDYSGARASWLRALDSSPLHLPTIDALWQTGLEFEDFKTLRQVMDIVRSHMGQDELWTRLGCEYANAVEGETGTEDFLRHTLKLNPFASEVRLALARRLLESGREREAIPHLVELSNEGIAEGAFLLGILSTRAAQYEVAISYMELAHELNPLHAQTVEQLVGLRQLIEDRDNGRLD